MVPCLLTALTITVACSLPERKPQEPARVSLASSATATSATTTTSADTTTTNAFSCGPESRVETLHHEVDLDLHDDGRTISGKGSLRFRARARTTTVSLDARGLEITSAESAGQNVAQITKDGVLCLELGRELVPGSETSVNLAWTVHSGDQTPRANGAQVWAGYNTAAWMPTDFDPAARATLALRIAAPQQYKVIASGRTTSSARADASRRVHSFELERPSPPFLFAFAAGDFEEATLDVEGGKLRALGPKGSDLAAALALTAPMLRFLVTKTGAPLPSSEYTQVFVQGDAAQEAAGFALIGAQSLADVRADPKEDWVFAHELAHQWFAWLVPCKDFADFWLNEGFATFLVAAIKEERWGREAYDREVELWRSRSQRAHDQGRDAAVSLAPPGLPRPSVKESELQARAITYSRGALVLHKLRSELGDAVFWDGVRRYVTRQANKGATSEDLRAAFELASNKDLAPFFARWVYSAAPDL